METQHVIQRPGSWPRERIQTEGSQLWAHWEEEEERGGVWKEAEGRRALDRLPSLRNDRLWTNVKATVSYSRW